MKKITLLTTAALLLASCNTIPPEAYFDHGSPESLMDNSAEVVNFDLATDAGITEMNNWINQDQPTRAELYCAEGNGVCAEAQSSLNSFGVPVTFMPSGNNTVTLYYERVLARDCENRFVDNSINPYNLAHPTYGCSTATNILQMVTDKRQITSPALLDYHDGERLERMMDGYKKPYLDTQKNVDPNLSNNETANLKTAGTK
jgi:hypothetical protein